jgi:hypothetical protein
LRYLIFLTLVFVFSCKKKGGVVVDPIIVTPGVTKNCKVLTDFRTDGQLYEFLFEKAKLVNIRGYNDFDTFVYNGDVIAKAFHSKNKNAEILFYWDAKLLKRIAFQGVDSQGKKFQYNTVITHNSKGKIATLQIEWPTFPERVNTRFNYDANENVSRIDAYIGNEWKVILENVSFDNKKSAYKSQELGQIFSYYMVYTILGGGFNFTHYVNNNNVLKSVVYQGESRISYNYNYTYNTNEYPTDVEYSRLVNNKTENYKQKFTYECEK